MEDNQPIGTGLPPMLKTAWILWFALIISIVVYSVVGFIVKGNMPPGQTTSNIPVITAALALAAAGDTLFILLAGRFFGSRSNVPFLTFSIIRWALSESIAIFGLVLLLLGASWVVFFAFWGWSFCLFLLLMPRKAAYDHFQSLRKHGAISSLK